MELLQDAYEATETERAEAEKLFVAHGKRGGSVTRIEPGNTGALRVFCGDGTTWDVHPDGRSEAVNG